MLRRRKEKTLRVWERRVSLEDGGFGRSRRFLRPCVRQRLSPKVGSKVASTKTCQPRYAVCGNDGNGVALSGLRERNKKAGKVLQKHPFPLERCALCASFISATPVRARRFYLHFSWRKSNTAANFCPSQEFGSTWSSPPMILSYSGPICCPRASALATSASTALSFPSSVFSI